MRKCCFNPAVQRERELRGENIQRGDKGRRAEKKGTKARSVHIFPLKKVIRASNRKGLPSQDSDAENVLRNSGKLERALGKASSFASNKKNIFFIYKYLEKIKEFYKAQNKGQCPTHSHHCNCYSTGHRRPLSERRLSWSLSIVRRHLKTLTKLASQNFLRRLQKRPKLYLYVRYIFQKITVKTAHFSPYFPIFFVS